MSIAIRTFLVVALLAFPASVAAQQAPEIEPSDAGAHIGDDARICGDVQATAYVPEDQGSPTYLRVGGTYPNQRINVIIPGEIRDQFPDAPEDSFRGTAVCATGTVELRDGAPSIVARGPDAIEVQESQAEG